MSSHIRLMHGTTLLPVHPIPSSLLSDRWWISWWMDVKGTAKRQCDLTNLKSETFGEMSKHASEQFCERPSSAMSRPRKISVATPSKSNLLTIEFSIAPAPMFPPPSPSDPISICPERRLRQSPPLRSQCLSAAKAFVASSIEQTGEKKNMTVSACKGFHNDLLDISFPRRASTQYWGNWGNRLKSCMIFVAVFIAWSHHCWILWVSHWSHSSLMRNSCGYGRCLADWTTAWGQNGTRSCICSYLFRAGQCSLKLKLHPPVEPSGYNKGRRHKQRQ